MEESEEFGNFDKKSSHTPMVEGEVESIGRVRMPRGKEVMGILEQRLGASRILIKCFDGKTRTCRVPGRLKRELWLREGDVVIVEPWEHQCDDKGDVIYKYSKAAVQWLKSKGYIKIEEEF
ncbi:MAG: translation initiation factor eIF-1A [Nanoarchaeota archaeon]|nr:translation initiation factor eIF-1A [Nanoarchaeota archaeon]